MDDKQVTVEPKERKFSAVETSMLVDQRRQIFVLQNKERLGGTKRAKKIFNKMMRDAMAKEGAKRIIQDLWDLSTVNPECKKCYGRGFDGRAIIGKDKEGNFLKAEIVCSCVQPRTDDEEETNNDIAPADSGVVDSIQEPSE